MGSRPQNRPPLWTADFVTVTFINLLIFLSFQMVMPVMPVYVRGPLGGSDVAVGVLSGIFTISAVVARPFVGKLVDTLGRKWILVVGLVIFAIGTFGYGLAATIFALAVFRIIHGLGFAGTSTATSTMAADAVPRERRSEGLGYFGMAGTATGAVAPALGFWLADHYSFNGLFNTSVLFALVALAFIVRLRFRNSAPVKPLVTGDSPPPPRSVATTLKSLIEPAAVPASVMMLIITLTYGALSAFIALFAEQLGMANPGLFFLVFALSILTSRPVAGTLADRMGVGPIMVPSIILAGLGFGIMWRAASPTILLVGGAVYGLGFGGMVPVLLAVAITQSPDHRRGAATATYYTAFDLGIALGASVMGPVAQHWGYRGVFGAQLLICTIGLLVLLRLLPRLSEPGPQPGRKNEIAGSPSHQ